MSKKRGRRFKKPTASLFSPENRQPVSSEDTTILVWDMNRPLQPGKFKKHLTEKDMTAHWQRLFQADANKADSAIWSLVYAAKDSVPFLKKHLRPAARPDADHVQRRLEALDSNNFNERRKAASELEKLGDLVLDKLEAALKKKNSLEKDLRLKQLLGKAQQAAQPFGTAERLGQ